MPNSYETYHVVQKDRKKAMRESSEAYCTSNLRFTLIFNYKTGSGRNNRDSTRLQSIFVILILYTKISKWLQKP